MEQFAMFSGLELQSLVVFVLTLFVASLRVGAFLVASPFFGSRMVPLPVRIVFSVALGLGALRFRQLCDRFEKMVLHHANL